MGEGHVAAVVDVDGRLADGVPRGDAGAAPWLRSVAGAPKKSVPKKKAAAKAKSQRGANLRGAQNPSVAARKRRAMGEVGGPADGAAGAEESGASVGPAAGAAGDGEVRRG